MTIDVTKTLKTARAKLDAGDDAAALVALISAWRSRRDARIADAIDRVSERITAQKDAIAAKSVKERTSTWMALAKKKDPSDLGRLLATPWPGTWQHALPVLEALVAFGEDPRIATALARLVDDAPYDTWTSNRFYRPLLSYLTKARDARTVPILEKDLEREKSSYWRSGTRPLIAAALAKLRADPASLSKKEEAALASVEAVFAGVTSAAKARARGEADFLRAIYDAPDDDAPRAVYADWLVERGDPRGELINLQLARQGKSGDELAAILKRETTLINKHGKAWAGALDPFLAREGRVFERGFLACGVLEIEGRPDVPPKGLADPAWATVHTLDFTFGTLREELTTATLALPSMRWLRTVRRLAEDVVVALAKRGPQPRLEEIDFEIAQRDDEDERDARAAGRKLLAAGDAFPSLKRLTIDLDPSEREGIAALEAILGGALGKRLERIATLDYDYEIGALLSVVERLRLPVREVCAGYPHGRRGVHWRLVLRRDDAGRFTRLRCEIEGGAQLPSASDLATALEGLQHLTEITVEQPKTVGYDESEIHEVERAIRRFDDLRRVEVPWERLEKKTTTKKTKAKGKVATPFVLSLHGDGIGSKLPELWRLVTEPPLSLSFDSYSVDSKGHKPLPADALAHTASLLAKKRTFRVQLYAKGTAEERHMYVGSDYAEIRCDEAPDADTCIEWLTRVCDALPVERGDATFMGLEGKEWSQLCDQPDVGPLGMFEWIHVLGPREVKRAARDGVAKLGGTKGLEWLRTAATKRNIVMVTADDPSRLPKKEARLALERALVRALGSR